MMAIKIRDLVRERSFYSEFQPLWDLESNTIFAYEAFIRSNPGISPLKLFQEARHNGYLYELDIASISNAIKEFPYSYLDKYFLFLNVFPSTIIHPDFPRFIKGLLDNYPDIKDRVVFEINEDVLEECLWRRESFSVQLSFLKTLGFSIAFDDFILTDSSYEKLTEFSPKYIKLDRSFSEKLPESSDKQRNINILLNKMETSMKLILEGIESAEELEVAKGLGVPILQGYYISRPKRL